VKDERTLQTPNAYEPDLEGLDVLMITAACNGENSTHRHELDPRNPSVTKLRRSSGFRHDPERSARRGINTGATFQRAMMRFVHRVIGSGRIELKSVVRANRPD
jgi:hypothetical protein